MDRPLYSVEHSGGLSVALCVVATATLLGIAYGMLMRPERAYAGFPVVTSDRTSWQRLWEPAHTPWIKGAKALIAKGATDCPGCFQVLTASGFKIVVPNRFANELKNVPHLSFNEALAKDLMVDYPGFDGHRESLKSDTFIQELTRVKLTQSLGLITDDLVEEARDSIRDCFEEVLHDNDWHTRLLKHDLLDIVSRMSSRVFLGKDLCRNATLMKLFKDHTADISVALSQLQMSPALIRPIVYWFIPACTRLRAQVHEITRLIMPEVEKRTKRVQDAIKRGEKPPKAIDSIAWMAEIARGRSIDYVAGQLAMSFAAIHMTTDAFCKCLIQLCETPEIVADLRAEIVQVLQENGWSRISLYKLKLVDSFLKEVQRTNPMADINMVRMVKQSTKLSDGTILPAGCRIMVLDNKVNDPQVFPKPAKFDVERFLRMRLQPGEENRHQFVTLTSDQLGFGLGTHACPGRFFAANEIKIAMCFMLLKYEFRRAPGYGAPHMVEFDMFRMCNPDLEIDMQRRQAKDDEKALENAVRHS